MEVVLKVMALGFRMYWAVSVDRLLSVWPQGPPARAAGTWVNRRYTSRPAASTRVTWPQDGWNRFDVLLVALAILDLAASAIQANFLRALRVLRMQRLLRAFRTVQFVRLAKVMQVGARCVRRCRLADWSTGSRAVTH